MIIRPAVAGDLPKIIELLRLSLGEASSPKSLTYWQWKHKDNPFGPSAVLVAEVDGQLAGSRAFMRWNWRYQGQNYQALRAVDTATHPDFRRRGIFRKLTLRLVADCQTAGDDFIFNTPNDQSRQGNLKLGWQALGKLPVRLSPRRPMQMLRYKLGIKKVTEPLALPAAFRAQDNWYTHNFDFLPSVEQPKGLHTAPSPAYLSWRYAQCPVLDYFALSAPGAFLAGHFRAQTFGMECRLSQICIAPEAFNERELSRQLRALLAACPADYLSAAPTDSPQIQAWLNRQGFLPALNIGPVLTFRPLQEETAFLRGTHPWAYQIGDLELF